MRFSIRDLFLVTVIVALAMGWWLDRAWQWRYCAEVERLLQGAEEERQEALRECDSADSLSLELMKDLDVIHPGWRAIKWEEIPNPIRHRRQKSQNARQSLGRVSGIESPNRCGGGVEG